MAENTKPVGIRIVRPYQTDDEFLSNELETVGKTSVILIGAHPRPTGVILRFEVTLASGATVLRGEGRVLGHKESAFRGQPGLSLRFTRLDPKSKALVDRAAAMREARLSGSSLPPPPRAPAPEPPPPPPPPPPAPEPEPAIAAALTAQTPEPPPASVDPSVEELPTHVDTRESSPMPIDVGPMSEPALESPRAAQGALAPPPDRDALLERLRQRARGLSPEAVDGILAGAKA